MTDWKSADNRSGQSPPQQAVDDYVTHMHELVIGWFEDLDAGVFRAIDETHRAVGVHGDFLEIGTYLGKSAIRSSKVVDIAGSRDVVEVEHDFAAGDQYPVETRAGTRDPIRVKMLDDAVRNTASALQLGTHWHLGARDVVNFVVRMLAQVLAAPLQTKVGEVHDGEVLHGLDKMADQSA
jgi:hypothetical protein